MKCGLKDGFINILLLIFITPSKGIEFPLFLHRSSVAENPMNLQQIRTSINRLQDLDSFPDNGDNQLHRIVKKQMASCDYKDARKNKRSVAENPLVFRGGAGDAANGIFKVKPAEYPSRPSTRDNYSQNYSLRHIGNEKAVPAVDALELLNPRNIDSTDGGSFFKKLKDFAKEKDILFLKRTKKNDPPNKSHPNCGKPIEKVEDIFRSLTDKLRWRGGKEDIELKFREVNKLEDKTPCENAYLSKEYTRFPDKNDFTCYYECETHPNGCLKLRHKRCPKGEFFSYKYLKCMHSRKIRLKKSPAATAHKKIELPDSGPEDSEPANEWLDATQGANQKIPSEFKPKKRLGLKIYHLRVKRRQDEAHRAMYENQHLWGGFCSHPLERRRKQDQSEFSLSHSAAIIPPVTIGKNKIGGKSRHFGRGHLPRHFVIRIHKKEDKYDQITENDENENDNDEDDEDGDEEEEDEDMDEEDEEGEDDEPEETVEDKHSTKEAFRDLIKSATAAITSRVRFDEPLESTGAVARRTSSYKSKKSNDSTRESNKDKDVLIDANIKVDSTISSVLKNLLKNKRKDKETNGGPVDDYETDVDLESGGPQGPEGFDLLMQNPRVKRYFMVNCAKKGN